MKILQLKPRANGRKIVGQKLPTFLDVTCCVRLNNLLHVVASCCAKFETNQTFSPVQTDATLLAKKSQHCWELLNPFARSFINKIKAWNVINHNTLLGTRALVGTPSDVSKFDFSDNFVSKNSAQIQQFTSWHCRVINLVDCSVLCIERNSKRALL